MNISMNIEEILIKFLSPEFDHSRSEIVNDPYSVLNNAIEIMYNKNMLQKDDNDSKYLLSKIEIFKGSNLKEFDKDRAEDFITDLKNYLK